jgi:hypothetical protein
LAQQTIEVLVAAAMPTAIRIEKVGLDAKGLIDGLVIGRRFAICPSLSRPLRKNRAI